MEIKGELGLELKGLDLSKGFDLEGKKTNIGDIFDLELEEIKSTKAKQKIIKLLAAGITGMGGMNLVAHIGVDQMAKAFVVFLGKYGISFLGVLPIPNYLVGVFVLYVLSEMYVGVKEVSDMKKGIVKKGGKK